MAKDVLYSVSNRTDEIMIVSTRELDDPNFTLLDSSIVIFPTTEFLVLAICRQVLSYVRFPARTSRALVSPKGGADAGVGIGIGWGGVIPLLEKYI